MLSDSTYYDWVYMVENVYYLAQLFVCLDHCDGGWWVVI